VISAFCRSRRYGETIRGKQKGQEEKKRQKEHFAFFFSSCPFYFRFAYGARLFARPIAQARYCPPLAVSILAAPLMKFAMSRCSFSRDFFSMYIMWPAS
jgi:hypothetical protein